MGKYDDLFAAPDDSARAGITLRFGIETRADEAAKSELLAKRYGVPTGVIQQYKPDYEARAKVEDAMPLLEQSPKLRGWLSENINNASMAQNDIANLANTERTFLGTAQDIGVVALKSAVGLPQAFVGLADIPTGGRVGKSLEGIGVKFSETQNILDQMYSPAQQAANRRVREAEGFMPTVVEALRNPSVIATTAGESIGSMLGGAGIARGLMAKFPTMSAWIAGAAGEGIIGAGSAAEQIREQTPDNLLTPAQSAAALASGVGTGLLGAAGGKVAQRLGLADIDTMLAKGGTDAVMASQLKQGFVKSIVGSGISEGLLEELPQSAQEQMWQNWALDRPIMEGVGNAAALGMLAGVATGGAAGGFTAAISRLETQQQAAQRQAKFVQDLSNDATNSELRKLNPQAYEAYVQQLGAGTPVETMYVDSEQLVNVLRQSGITDEQLVATLPEVAEQLRQAAPGSDIQIPTAQYAARLAGTDLGNALAPHLRIDQDLPSAAESVQIEQQRDQIIRDAAEVMTQKLETDKAFIDSAKVVEQRMFEQLKATKQYTDSVSRTNAQFVRDFVVTQAAALGMTPEAFYDRYMYKVQMAGQQVAGDVLSQITPEQAMATNVPMEMPADPIFAEAVGNTNGAQITENGLLIDLVRFQKPEQEGAQAIRTGVFYLPAGSKQVTGYKGGNKIYGGPDKFEGQTLIRRPLFVKGATGGKAPEAAYDMLKGKGAYEAMRSDVLAKTLNYAEPRSEKAKRVAAVLEKYGANPGLAFEIVENSTQGNQLAYATQENIVAHAVREAGYDAVVGYSKAKGANRISEVFDVRELTFPARGMESQINERFLRQSPAALPMWSLERAKGARITDADKKAAIALAPTAKQARKNYDKLDAVFAKVPDPLASEEAWRKFMSLLVADRDVLGVPYNALRYAQSPEAVAEYLTRLRPDQLASRRAGFELGARIRKEYIEGRATPVTTGRLLLWAMLSRKAGAYPHEAAYMDLVNGGVDQWIEKAVNGTWSETDSDAYVQWSSDYMASKKGGVSPSAGVTSNANDFGRILLTKMSEKDANGETALTRLHNLIADQNVSTDQVRREFFALGDSLGIQNKVLSFALLVTGRWDTLVLDRVQFTHLWGAPYREAARAAGVKPNAQGLINIYDPPQGGLAPAGEGHFGVAIYEALARGMTESVRRGYELAGLTEMGDGTLGAFHWDSWLIESSQAIGHPTIEALDTETPRPDLAVRQGKFDTYGYNFEYRADGQYQIPLLDGSGYRLLSPAEAAEFAGRLSDPKQGVVPRDFKVSQNKTRPWVDAEGVNRGRYDEILAEYGRRADAGDVAPAGAPDAGGPVQQRAADAGAGVFQQAAFHGSPARGITQFSTDFIGTGEGAQAYGWGLYFASQRAIAEHYRKMLAKGAQITQRGRNDYVVTAPDGSVIADGVLYGSATKAKEDYDARAGQLYEVDIPEDSDMLDWDKPLSEQPEAVQPVIDKILNDPRRRQAGFSADRVNAFGEEMTGADLYAAASATWFYGPGGARGASQFFSDNGIKGIKYLDGTSRGAGDGSYNYVIFSGDDVAIRNQFYQRSAEVSRAMMQGGAAPRGGFDPRRLTTILNEKADLSTFLHETAHFFLTVYADMASQPNATERMKADMQTLLNWFGVKDLATWNAMSLEEQRKYHEQFAYSYELYLFEGKAPSVEMQTLFERFASWLRRTYQSIRDDLNRIYRQEHGEDLPILTGEVRQVMDRMLASEQQIQQAEQVRSMAPIFQSQDQSGMGDAEWAAYQAMLQEARDAAVTDLTKASMRQMKWLQNARSRILKDLQKQADAQRKEVRAEVTAEVEQEPVYRAMRFLKRGEFELPADANAEMRRLATETGMSGTKLSLPALKEMYGEAANAPWRYFDTGQYGMVATEGLHPDVVAEMFGFQSGDEMVRALLAAAPLKEAIDSRTDQVMLERYGEMSDPKAIELAVESALHNQARARFVAVELRHMAKATQPVRVMLEAARQAARATISGRVVSQVRPKEFSVAEARAARLAADRMKKGDSLGAAQAKQAQLLQNQLAAEAAAVRQEIDKALESFKKFFRSDDKVAKNRNMDLVDAARSILAYYGLGPKGKSPVEYIEKLRAYNADLYAEIEPLIIKAATGSAAYTDLTVDEFRAMRDTVEALWFQSKRENEVMIEGKTVALDDVTGELSTRLEQIGIPDVVPGETMAPGKKDRLVRSFYAAKAIMRRVEHWADAIDGPKGSKPFTRYIWRPIRAALDAYRIDRNKYVKRYVELIKKLELPVAKIEAPELNYTFGNENGGIGKAELIGALLHTGNESNLKKLLLGRGWADQLPDGTVDSTRWKAFEARMIAEGKLTKADYDFAQAVWDLNEEIKPMAQKAHHDIFGYYFKEVQASPVATPFGVYRGGYVPAKTDPFIVRDAQRQAKMEEIESDFRQSMPSTGLGFTKARVEYNKALSLDIRLMAKHIDDVIRFSHVQPVVKDTLRILRRREFADNLTRIDPTAIEDMLMPWLNRSARQITTDAGMHKSVDTFWRAVRSRTGIAIMFANITNALQQLTGYFPAALKVQPKYLKGAMASYLGGPQKVTEEVASLSKFMADRLNNQVFDMQDTMNELLLNPSKFEKIQAWASHHGYFLQQAFQNQVDVVTWTGAFNQALAELGAKKTDEQAVREATQRADAAVRMTQSSLLPEDIAAFEVGSPFYKTLVQFSGYFNMIANLNANEYVKVFRDLGWRGNKGKLFMIYLLGFGLPMLISDAIVRSLGGQWDDDDDDGYLDEVMEWFFGSQIRGAVALVPAFGPGVAAIGNAFNNKPYDDRMTTSPSVSALEGATVGVAKAAINIASDDKEVTGKNIRDILTALSLITGIPLTVLGRPIGYAVDVERGKIQPTSDMDYVRGLVTGKASEESRP